MSRSSIIPPTPSEEFYRVEADQGDVFTREDPFALFEDWFALARAHEPNDANAMSLATVDADGAPDVRILLLKDVSAAGFSFYSSAESVKGRQLAANPQAALAFHWKSIRRQVRVRGAVSLLPEEDADAYFAERARGARIAAWASAQSAPIAPGETLQARFEATSGRFEGKDVPRPAHWRGFRLAPRSIEFWVNRPFRLHDRLVFIRRGAGWDEARLYP